MRDLHKILKLFENDFVMDYCEDFDDIKSILEHCNKHVKPFAKVHFRGGNEPFINELGGRLQELLLSKHYVDETTKLPLESASKMLRKIMLFLIANTDATYKYNLHDDPVLGHVIEMCPLLPKFLLVTMVWDLKLDRFFCETLSYTPCWFSFQYFEPASDSMKYIDDPFEVLQKVDNLVTAIFLSIARSDLRQMEIVEKKIIYGKLYDYATNFMRQFFTPDVEKFKHFTKIKLHKYFGYALKHLLEMLMRFFDIYEQPEKATEPAIDVSIFEFCQELCKPVPATKQSSDLVNGQLLKIIQVVLNALQSNVMQIKIDIFMYWVEIDLSDSLNLQMAIGELAYGVGERIKANRSFAHDVEHQLPSIAIRPKTLEETVRDATLGDILRSLDEALPYHIKKVWFDELFNRTVALGNDECLQSIKENIKLMNVENCQQILDYIKLELDCKKQSTKPQDESVKIEEVNAEEENQNQEEIKNELESEQLHDDDDEEQEADTNMDVDEDYEDLTALILCALPNFKPEQLLKLISYELRLFGENTTICCASPVEFNQRATEFLNKYSTANFDYQGFLVLCFEHPQAMWTKFFNAACHNIEHVNAYCTTVRDARPMSNSYFYDLLHTAMQDMELLQQKFFPSLLCEIYFTLYYPERKTDFLKQFINKNVNEMLDAQNFTGLQSIMRALNLIAARGETQSHKPLNFGEVTAPVLLMAAQVMEKTRWDLITYTDERDEILRECIQFIQNTTKKFLPVATEKDRKWITKVMKDSYRPITQYYFQKFSQAPDQPALDFDRFLIRLEIEDKSEAEMFLIINYVRCTLKEAEWLARSERLLPHISDMMLILGGVVTETANPNSINNYRHCMVNYAHIVMKFILPQLGNDNRKIEKLAIKVLKIIESSPAEIYEEMFMSFEWLLMEILKKSSPPLEDGQAKHVRNAAKAMKDCKAKQIFLEKFQAFVTECAN